MTMHRRLVTFPLCLILFLSTAVGETVEQAALMRPLGAPGRYSFAPNQLAAAEWYKPAGQLVNGHVEESFGNEKNWPKLHRFLRDTNGAFGVNAAEIGYLTSDWLLKLRRAGIGLSAEAPAWTQCSGGRNLAQTEIFGTPIAGHNLFQSTFHIHVSQGRSDPIGHGWFFTKDSKDYAPDEILLDHRILFLLPRFDNDLLLAANSGLSWQARKDAARRDPCPLADKFHDPFVDRLTGALLDYVDYASIMAQKFPAKPALSFHWNVNPAWEWGDEQCLDALHEFHPDAASFEEAFRYLEKPCHRDTAILARLVEMLCATGGCPTTVFMDADLTYQTAYSLDVLRRNREMLRRHGVGFGVDLTDECNEQISCVQIVSGPSKMSFNRESADGSQSENMLAQKSLVNKFMFLVANGIVDADTYIRFESWSVRPAETTDKTAESKKGSFANTALFLSREVIRRHGWGRKIQSRN